MCGILGVVNTREKVNAEYLIKACNVIRHRGPDDEGFLTWSVSGQPQIWAGGDTADSTSQYWNYEHLSSETLFNVGFGHRRLSILDLSPAGHQPMLFKEAGLALCFNGEVYNYIEIKNELEKLGHKFTNKTDSEVILHAWAEWGPACLSRFNGMFAFLILDYKNNKFYAVRDRFGVKPLYYYRAADGTTVLSSEIKQIRLHKTYKPQLDEALVKQYLALGSVDHTYNTLDKQVHQLPGGSYMEIDLSNQNAEPRITTWYKLEPKEWKGSWDDAVANFRDILIDAVKLRLRADVKVGSCLSGGLDSSSIVCIAADLLKKQGDFAGQETVTACYDEKQYDEWHYAQEVIRVSNAHPHQTFPSFKQLESELDAFLWHQDEPTGSTSQFSQWAVFKRTHEAGLKVMVDGQGADEQLAGYGGNDIPFYAGMLKRFDISRFMDESKAYKQKNGSWPYSSWIGALQTTLGKAYTGLVPTKYHLGKAEYNWLKQGGTFEQPLAGSLKESLMGQVYGSPLPSLLRYEDRNSMAFSVESRTPFMDYRLLEFTLGLPDHFILKHGVRKRILRDSMRGIVPDKILDRTDKMGFVTPEETWLKGEGKDWFVDWVNYTCTHAPELVDSKKLKAEVDDIITGKLPFSFLPWRIGVFGNWLNKNV